MNVTRVISELETKYPNKMIVENHRANPTEIICEIEPTSDHPEWSKAVAVIDRSLPHFHIKSTEKYTVLRGILTITKEGKNYNISEGQSFIIYPMEHHSAKGNGVWVECKSIPGWTFDDHIFIKQ